VSACLSRHTETFIVRFWAEYLEQSPPAWRGEIEHVGRGEVIRCGSLCDMSDRIQCHVLTQDGPESEQEEGR
jgi:hypothetical protein